MTLKTILLSAAVTFGMAACHHDRATNTPASNTYGTSADGANPAAAPHTYGTSGADTTNTTPDMNATGQTGAAGVQNGTDRSPTTPPVSQPPGAINSTNNASGNNAANFNKSGARTDGNYNNSKNGTPASTNGTNVNTDSDMDRTGNSGTTKEGNPGTANPTDR